MANERPRIPLSIPRSERVEDPPEEAEDVSDLGSVSSEETEETAPAPQVDWRQEALKDPAYRARFDEMFLGKPAQEAPQAPQESPLEVKQRELAEARQELDALDFGKKDIANPDVVTKVMLYQSKISSLAGEVAALASQEVSSIRREQVQRAQTTQAMSRNAQAVAKVYPEFTATTAESFEKWLDNSEITDAQLRSNPESYRILAEAYMKREGLGGGKRGSGLPAPPASQAFTQGTKAAKTPEAKADDQARASFWGMSAERVEQLAGNDDYDSDGVEIPYFKFTGSDQRN